MPVIGFLGAATLSAQASYVDAFRHGVAAAVVLGDRTVAVELRSLAGLSTMARHCACKRLYASIIAGVTRTTSAIPLHSA